jgi:hypothetical protein
MGFAVTLPMVFMVPSLIGRFSANDSQTSVVDVAIIFAFAVSPAAAGLQINVAMLLGVCAQAAVAKNPAEVNTSAKAVIRRPPILVIAKKLLTKFECEGRLRFRGSRTLDLCWEPGFAARGAYPTPRSTQITAPPMMAIASVKTTAAPSGIGAFVPARNARPVAIYR